MKKRSLSTIAPPAKHPSEIKNVKNKQNNNIVRINRIWPSIQKIKETKQKQRCFQQSCGKNKRMDLKEEHKKQNKIGSYKQQNQRIKDKKNLEQQGKIAFTGLQTNKINNQIISHRKQSSKSVLTKENKLIKNATGISTNSHLIIKTPIQRQNLRKQLVQQILTQTKQKIKEQVEYQKKQNHNLNKSKYHNQPFNENLYPINLTNQQLNQSQRERIRNLKVTIQNSDKVTQDGTIPIKLVLVGDGSVGKTSMLVSYTTDNFPTDYVPTIFNNYVADIKVGPHKVKLWLWDTAGQQQYAQLRLISYQKADIFLICFSMIDQVSFHNAINKWLPQIQQQCPNSAKIFVGTKSDLHNQYLQDPKNIHNAIPLDYIKKKCHGKKCDFMACSGLNQKGLNEVFTKAMNIIIQKVHKKKKAQQQNCQLI